ncbi:MAG: VanZ family protein [Bacilli bacterium]|nr:VanZ family protein [Bacilli bacterium]
MIPNEVNVVIKNVWPMLILFIIVLVSVRIVDIIINKKEFIFYKELSMLIFLIYMFLLFELVTTTDFESFSNNFIPFKEIMRYPYNSSLFYKNVLGNVLLFVPFGYFVNNKLKNKSIIINIFMTLVTSLSIEIIQMNIGRSFDIDDIILNLLGGIIGYIIYRIFSFIKNKLPKVLNKNWFFNILWIILMILGTLFLLNYYGLLEVL